jgi:hypothetical protein
VTPVECIETENGLAMTTNHIRMTRDGPVGEVDTHGCRNCPEVTYGANVNIEIEQSKATRNSIARRAPMDCGEVLGQVAKVERPVSPRPKDCSGRRQLGTAKGIHINSADKQ